MKPLETLTNEAISIIQKIYNDEKNKKRIENFTGGFMDSFIDKLKPYFFLITGLLILVILMNSVQFYYYIKVYLKQFKDGDKFAAAQSVLE